MLPEIETYLTRLHDRRAQVLRCVQELSPDALDWKPVAQDTNSIAVLAIHCLGAERQWLHAIVGKMNIERNRDAEFRSRAEDATALPAMYAAASDVSERILSALTPEEMDAPRSYLRYNESVRWCIVHVLEHYSEHLGQMWLTRQLYESSRRE